MNVIDLFWFAFFVGGGALAGFRLAGGLGALAGAVAGGLLLFVIGRAAAWNNSQLPTCLCGAGWRDMAIEQQNDGSWLHRCRTCGRGFEMRGGSVWRELTPTGERVVRMRRHFLGRWFAVPEKR